MHAPRWRARLESRKPLVPPPCQTSLARRHAEPSLSMSDAQKTRKEAIGQHTTPYNWRVATATEVDNCRSPDVQHLAHTYGSNLRCAPPWGLHLRTGSPSVERPYYAGTRLSMTCFYGKQACFRLSCAGKRHTRIDAKSLSTCQCVCTQIGVTFRACVGRYSWALPALINRRAFARAAR